jgi:hypothetical protein
MQTVKSNYVGVFGITLPGHGSSMRHVDLYPGINQVEDQDWAEALKNSMVQIHLKAGTLEDLQADVTNIGKVAEPEAIELVELTVRAELLENWSLQEKRPAVAKAIRDQLKAIDPKEHARTKKEEEGS